MYLQGHILPAPTPWSQHQATPHSAGKHPPFNMAFPKLCLGGKDQKF